MVVGIVVGVASLAMILLIMMISRRKKKDIRRRNTEITYADIAEKNTLRNPHD